MIDIDTIRKEVVGLSPEDHHQRLLTIKAHLDLAFDEFASTYTYCTGCRRYIKLSDRYDDIDLENRKRLIRCKHCDMIHRIKDIGEVAVVEKR